MLELHADFHRHQAGVYFVFPRGQTDVEVGYMIFRDGREGPLPALQARQLMGSRSKIDKQQARHRFEQVLDRRPELSAPLADSRVTFSYTTYLPMPRIEPDLVPVDHLFMVGDVAGTVEGRGGSGVLASYLLGLEVGRLAAGSLSARWEDSGLRKRYNQQLRRHPVYAKVLRSQRLPIPIVQTYLHQDQRLTDTLWPVFSKLL